MKNKNICSHSKCRKKIDIVQRLTNKCICEKIFCNEHRLPEKHDCTYDYIKHVDKEKEINKLKCVYEREKI